LALALAAGRMGAWEWNVSDGRVIWSPGLEEMHGLAPGSFGGSFEDFQREIVDEDLPMVIDHIKRALDEASDYHVTYRMRRPDGEIRWIEAHGKPLPGNDGRPVKMIGVCLDVTPRKQAEQQMVLLINELNHRVKNTLATVQAIAAQTLRGSHVGTEIRKKLDSRLIALSSAHSILTESRWEGAEIHQIIRRSLAPHGDPDRFQIQGPAIHLSPKAAVAIAMSIHELATNAVKYGALSTAEGWIELTWTLVRNTMDLKWQERGGPPVSLPDCRGFGSRLIERNLAHDLNGEASIHFEPDGVVCTIVAPLEALEVRHEQLES
jgi:PAS domain S-box-containing protein